MTKTTKMQSWLLMQVQWCHEMLTFVRNLDTWLTRTPSMSQCAIKDPWTGDSGNHAAVLQYWRSGAATQMHCAASSLPS